MPNLEISNLPAASTLAGGEYLAVVQSGTTARSTVTVRHEGSVLKTADQTYDGTTLTNDTHLKWTATDNVKYRATAVVAISAGDETGDGKMTVYVPSGATGWFACRRLNTGAGTPTASVNQELETTFGSEAPFGIDDTNATLQVVEIYVDMTGASADGDVGLQYAENSDGTNFSVLEGSELYYREVS